MCGLSELINSFFILFLDGGLKWDINECKGLCGGGVSAMYQRISSLTVRYILYMFIT